MGRKPSNKKFGIATKQTNVRVPLDILAFFESEFSTNLMEAMVSAVREGEHYKRWADENGFPRFPPVCSVDGSVSAIKAFRAELAKGADVKADGVKADDGSSPLGERGDEARVGGSSGLGASGGSSEPGGSKASSDGGEVCPGCGEPQSGGSYCLGCAMEGGGGDGSL